MSWFRRQPDETLTVEVGGHPRTQTVPGAMGAMRGFSNLCMNHKLSIVMTEGTSITVQGRPKQIKAFKAKFDFLHGLGLL